MSDHGVALLADGADAVDVLGDDLDGGLRLPLADGDDLRGLLLDGGIPFAVIECKSPKVEVGQLIVDTRSLSAPEET